MPIDQFRRFSLTRIGGSRHLQLVQINIANSSFFPILLSNIFILFSLYFCVCVWGGGGGYGVHVLHAGENQEKEMNDQ